MQYTQDYDERFPIAYDFNNGNGTGWDSRVAPYVGARVQSGTSGSASIFVCPSDTSTLSGNNARTYSLVRTGGAGFANSTDATTNSSLGRSLAEFPSVATTLMAAERPSTGNIFGRSDGAGNLDRPAANAVTDGNAQNTTAGGGLGRELHFDGWNYLFVDGHVKWLRPANTVDNNTGDATTGTVLVPRGMWTIVETD